MCAINTLRPRQNGCRFADDTFKCIFLNKNIRILIKISLKFVPKGPINNNPALVQIMVWRRSGDKPLSEPMMVSLLTHICVTRPQWIKVNDGPLHRVQYSDVVIFTHAHTNIHCKGLMSVVILTNFSSHFLWWGFTHMDTWWFVEGLYNIVSSSRDQSVYAPSQRETMLQCNVVFLW